MWIKKSLQAIPHLHLSTSLCCYLQALELQWLRDQNRGREPDHRELLTPFLMRFPFLSFSFHGPLNFEFSSTIMLRELESSEPREPSRVHLCPLCRFQTLSGLCMTNTVSVYTGFLKKHLVLTQLDRFLWPVPSFLGVLMSRAVSFLTINSDCLARLNLAEEREAYNFIPFSFFPSFFPSFSPPPPPPILSKLAENSVSSTSKGQLSYFDVGRLRSRLWKVGFFLFNLFSWDSFQSNISKCQWGGSDEHGFPDSQQDHSLTEI